MDSLSEHLLGGADPGKQRHRIFPFWHRLQPLLVGLAHTGMGRYLHYGRLVTVRSPLPATR